MNIAKLKLIKLGLLVSSIIFGIGFLLFIGHQSKIHDLSNGFGRQYHWHDYEDALKIAIKNQTPIMVIVYKNDCPACEVFKSRFSKSHMTLELSKNFVMVNLNDEESHDEKLSPDGKYYPRVLFLDHRGTVKKDIYNMGGNQDYKYFYFNIKPVVDSMTEAISAFKKPKGSPEL